jgi:plastocyanin
MHRSLRLVAIAVLVAAVASVAACSGSQGGAAASPVATSTVDLPPSYKFVPVDIVVRAGTKVTWTNHDHFSHSVQFLDGGLPTDPLVMNPDGATATFTFATAGTYHYQCSFHPQNMKGSVTVTP